MTGWRTINVFKRMIWFALLMTAILIPGGMLRAQNDDDELAASGGWEPQLFPSIRAIEGARISSTFHHSGKRSLAVAVHLDGSQASKKQGEIYVDLRYHPPAGVEAPVDMTGQTISAWVYAPAGLMGPPKNPNGIRLFVKDGDWHSEYGRWTHVTPGGWTHLTFTPAADAPKTGYRDEGFDPHKIILLGVSLATGGGSAARFNGFMAIDDVGWGPNHLFYSFEES